MGRKIVNLPIDWFYHEFWRKKNACCTLAFKYQNFKKSDWISSIIWWMQGCLQFFFSKKACQNQRIKECFKIMRFGEVTQHNDQRKFRPAKYLQRGKIARAVSSGVSYYYTACWKKTPVEEIMAVTSLEASPRMFWRKYPLRWRRGQGPMMTWCLNSCWLKRYSKRVAVMHRQKATFSTYW